MFKGLLIIVVLLGFAWAYPPTRAKMANAAAPAVEKLGPVGQAMAKPVQKYSADNEIAFILDYIEIEKLSGRELPDDRTFMAWMKRKRVQLKRGGDDPWGKPYFPERKRGTITVGSSGPDREKSTADDIRKSIPF
jgi:hypothetical protein